MRAVGGGAALPVGATLVRTVADHRSDEGLIAVSSSSGGRHRGTSRYREVAEALRERIVAGDLPPAAPLPSESQMTLRFGVSRPTVRAAVALLVSEGLVVTLPGRGSFVRRAVDWPSRRYVRAVRTSVDGTLLLFDATLDDPRWRLVEQSRTVGAEASPDVARALGLVEDLSVTTTHQLHADSADHRLTYRSHVPAAVVRSLGSGADLPTDPASTYALLMAAGHELHWTEGVRARMPLGTDADVLGIGAGTPMLTVGRTTFDEHRRPLLFEETRVSADDAQLDYHIEPTT